MNIYFFTLVSTQIADPASVTQARVRGTVPKGAVSVSSEPLGGKLLQKGSSDMGLGRHAAWAGSLSHPMAGPASPSREMPPAHLPCAHPQA